jgi:MFS family permease
LPSLSLGPTYRSLRVPNYRRYFVGYLVSVIGGWMQRVGQDWLILELTHSSLALSLSLVAQFLPMLVLGFWGGVVVDRVDTRRLLIVTQALQMVLAVLLSLFTVLHVATLPAVYVLAALLGVVTVFDNPARQIFVNQVVAREDLVNAVVLNSVMNNIGRLIGPAIGGIAIAAFGVAVTFEVNAVSFIAVLIGLVLIRPADLHPREAVTRGRGQVREGLRYIWADPVLRQTLIVIAVVSTFGQNFRVILPILATNALHGGAEVYGWLTAMLGLGAVLGAVVVARATNATTGRALASCALFAMTNLALAVVPNLITALAVVVAMGAVNMSFNTVSRSVLQLQAEPALRGRVMAVYVIVFLGATPIGGPISGLLCAVAGARVALLVAGAVCLAPVLVIARHDPKALWRRSAKANLSDTTPASEKAPA